MTPRPGSKSTAKGTKKLSPSKFAYPRLRKYPIDTRARARNALARAAQDGTFGSLAHVRRAVARRYPGLGSKTKKKS